MVIDLTAIYPKYPNRIQVKLRAPHDSRYLLYEAKQLRHADGARGHIFLLERVSSGEGLFWFHPNVRF